MIGDQGNLTILILIGVSCVNTTLTLIAFKKLAKANEVIALLALTNKELRRENKKIEATAKRIFSVVKLHDDDLECAKMQMAQVHHWLGDVLNISNLIDFPEQYVTSSTVIESLQQRVEWEKEIKQKEPNNADYYES
ncbi:hypothetical protein QT972_09745 [Microcoleus sp. herbarium7]|uniref:hypothetical protein n=1 Tax=Microcoleus sp. herbarium7 TaxID=3055435 RepID=UPI002FD4CF0F